MVKIIISIGKFFLNIIYFFIKLIPASNKITMISRQSDNPSLDFKLLEKELKEKYKVILLCKKLNPGIINKIKYCFHMLKQMYHIATSKVVILDSYCIPISILKQKKKLTVIQMWHAMGALKKFGYSSLESDTETSALDKKMTVEDKVILSKSMNMHKGYDYIFTSSEYNKDKFAEAFGYDLDKMVVMPLPIVDYLRDDKEKLKVKNKINDTYKLKGKKTIVYVPTFRRKEKEEKIQELIDSVDYKKYNLIVKLHPLTKIKHKDKRVIWDNKYSSRDMMIIADYVITDYSAIVYEASILEKPLFFYAYDYKDYVKERNFYIDYNKEMPGIISSNANDILKAIDDDNYDLEKIRAFRDKNIDLDYNRICYRIHHFIDETTKDYITLDKKIRRTYFKLKKSKNKIIKLLMIRVLAHFYKVKDNRVLFISDVRESLGGNLQMMDNYISDKDYEKVYCFRKNRQEVETFSKKVERIKLISSSKYILLDDYCSFVSFMKPKKSQKIVQLWHGPGAFKTFGYTRKDKKKTFFYKYGTHRNYTDAIVTSENIRWCYAEAFGMDIKGVHAVGFPRTDIFFDKKYINDTKKNLYAKYPEFKGKKIIMFAPTYRGTTLPGSFYDYSKLDVDKIYEELHDEYIFIIKWHPGLAVTEEREIFNDRINKYKDFYYDFTKYRDINDLLLITDELVTDYSSVIFDYLLINKPIVYFAYDLEEYNSDRGLYFDYEKYLYGPVAKDSDELIKCLKRADMCEKERKEFKNTFMEECDGNSTLKTYNMIFKNKN